MIRVNILSWFATTRSQRRPVTNSFMERTPKAGNSKWKEVVSSKHRISWLYTSTSQFLFYGLELIRPWLLHSTAPWFIFELKLIPEKIWFLIASCWCDHLSMFSVIIFIYMDVKDAQHGNLLEYLIWLELRIWYSAIGAINLWIVPAWYSWSGVELLNCFAKLCF